MFGKAYVAPSINWTRKEATPATSGGGGGAVHPFFVQGACRTLVSIPLLENPGRVDEVLRRLSAHEDFEDVVFDAETGTAAIVTRRPLPDSFLEQAVGIHGFRKAGELSNKPSPKWW